MSTTVTMPILHPVPPEIAPLAHALREKTVRFAHLLRNHGFSVGLKETEDTLRVAEVFLCFDMDSFHLGLRTLLCLSIDQYAPFDELFNRYWRPGDGSEMISPRGAEERRGQPREGEALLQTLGWADRADETGETLATSGASGQDAMRRVDFSGCLPRTSGSSPHWLHGSTGACGCAGPADCKAPTSSGVCTSGASCAAAWPPGANPWS
ncbi:MAG: hypothetical protein IIA40_00665 [SAR324 cluster bacterium]|nr:hypothetical protein [SAR324 cluster bacterium]